MAQLVLDQRMVGDEQVREARILFHYCLLYEDVYARHYTSGARAVAVTP
jgi:hypothetical protein